MGQVNALLAWLHGGGHLIVGVEQISDITATPWLRSVLPCELNDMRTVQGHPELQEWLRSANWPTRRGRAAASAWAGCPGGAASAPRPGREPRRVRSAICRMTRPLKRPALQVATGQVRDGQVVVAAGDKPLIVTANRGCGRVTLLLFSPEREPFRSWKNLPTFWAKLAEVPGAWYVSADYRQPGGWSSDGIFGAMIDTRQVHKLPVTWLLLLLMVYLVVIGPLDQHWLKRIGRPMLTWITFPCYVVLFSLLIYFIGYKLRAGESEWNELHLVDVLLKGDQAELRGQTYASVYSPSNQRYTLEGRQEFATLRSEFAGTVSAGAIGRKGDLHAARRRLVQGGDLRAGLDQPAVCERLVAAGAGAAERHRGSPGRAWQVTVENRTERSPDQRAHRHRGLHHDAGRGSRAGDQDLHGSREKGTAAEPTSSADTAPVFRGGAARGRGPSAAEASGRIDDLPNASMAASFLSHLSEPHVDFDVPLHRAARVGFVAGGGARQRGAAGVGGGLLAGETVAPVFPAAQPPEHAVAGASRRSNESKVIDYERPPIPAVQTFGLTRMYGSIAAAVSSWT